MPAVADPLTRTAALFHALSDETRLEILELLRDGERCVCELQAELDAAQSRLSFHLRVLREAGLVNDRREGRWMYYTLATSTFAEVHASLARLSGSDAAVPGAPKTAKAATAGAKRALRVVTDCCG
ncbi:MAG: metalloregulator ArsR/SmtB family transcription factor [Gemmatimonadetes bacterium]|nr:metalloregulator ArsR/SmtB family transcription factor [Gemmatimonadota bacterium]